MVYSVLTKLIYVNKFSKRFKTKK